MRTVAYLLRSRPNPCEKCPTLRISAPLQTGRSYPSETVPSSSARFLILLYCRNFWSDFSTSISVDTETPGEDGCWRAADCEDSCPFRVRMGSKISESGQSPAENEQRGN
jgi:hypothetical protein